MEKQIVTFTGISQIVMEASPLIPNKAVPVETNIRMEVSDNLEREMYHDNNGLTNAEGTKAMTRCFIQGLIGCIHVAHENGYRDSAENLRFIIDEITKGFAAVVHVDTAVMMEQNIAQPLEIS